MANNYEYSRNKTQTTTSGKYDYDALIRGLSGGGGGRGQGGGYGNRGFGRAGGDPVLGGINQIHARLPGGTGPSIPVMDVQSAAQYRNAQAAMPYMYKQQEAAQQQAAQMELARLQGGISLANSQMQIEAQEMAEMKARDHALELQRRAALENRYGQSMQQYYRYGLGE